MKKNMLLLLCAVALAAITALAAFGVTTAWLSQNRRTEAQRMEMQINAKNLHIEQYMVFQCNENKSGAPYEIAAAQDGKYTMADFDSIFRDQNDYHGLLIAVKLISFPEGMTGIKATFSTEELSEPYKTSNIVFVAMEKMDSFEFPTDGTVSKELNTALHDVRKALRGPEANSDNRRVFTDGTAEFANISVSGEPVTLLFLLDYDEDLVTDLKINPFTVDDVAFDKMKVPFVNDFSTILFEPVF